MFVLPPKVHRDVDKILQSYLWRGKGEGRGGVKVAWDEVYLPFDEGGPTSLRRDRCGSSILRLVDLGVLEPSCIRGIT